MLLVFIFIEFISFSYVYVNFSWSSYCVSLLIVANILSSLSNISTVPSSPSILITSFLYIVVELNFILSSSLFVSTYCILSCASFLLTIICSFSLYVVPYCVPFTIFDFIFPLKISSVFEFTEISVPTFSVTLFSKFCVLVTSLSSSVRITFSDASSDKSLSVFSSEYVL